MANSEIKSSTRWLADGEWVNSPVPEAVTRYRWAHPSTVSLGTSLPSTASAQSPSRANDTVMVEGSTGPTKDTGRLSTPSTGGPVRVSLRATASRSLSPIWFSA